MKTMKLECYHGVFSYFTSCVPWGRACTSPMHLKYCLQFLFGRLYNTQYKTETKVVQFFCVLWEIRGGSRTFFRRGCTRLLLHFNTNKPHTFFFLQNTSCIRKAQVISGGGVCTPCTLPLDPPLEMCTWWIAATHFFTKIIVMLYWVHITLKLIKLWRVLRAFSFKTRCNLRESDKILNICKKTEISWIIYSISLPSSYPLWPFPALAKFCDTCIYIYWSDSSGGSRGGPPGGWGRPP